MSKIAILGTGRVATVLAGGLAATGHDITMGGTHPDEAASRWKGPDVSITDSAAAASSASIVINATPGDSALEYLGRLAPALDGKILVDVANATTRGAAGEPEGLTYPNGSLAEHLQQALPRTRVVKTLNTMLFTVMANPGGLGTRPTAFLSGDDDEAKAIVRGLLGDLGWDPDQVLDLGGISTARGPEAMMLLVPAILRVRGFAPFAITVVA